MGLVLTIGKESGTSAISISPMVTQPDLQLGSIFMELRNLATIGIEIMSRELMMSAP